MMNKTSVTASLILGITLSLGLASAGFFIADALYKLRVANRYVTVKGLAEREVAADLAIWPLAFHETGNDLNALQNSLDADRMNIRKFLSESGFKENEISESPPRITDYYAQGYMGANLPQNRYKAEATLTLRSSDVNRVRQAMEKSGELVRIGIVLANTYGRGTDFLFTGLNAVKPEMIAQATKNARKAAEQFAKDSGSKVGSIRRARQGLFTIQNRDMNTPELKKIRVVTSVDYFLVEE